MKNLFKSVLLTTGIILVSSIVNAGAVVVVGSSSSISSTGKADIVKVFLGKKKEIGGVKIVPIDQSSDSASRLEFYSTTVKKSESQLKSYWSRLIFTGKGQSPQVVGVDADVKSMLASNPNMIGYIDETQVDSSIKVIYKP